MDKRLYTPATRGDMNPRTKPQSPPTPYPTPRLPTPLSAFWAAWERLPLVGRVLLPLRAFLGITFVYAGIQKLTDPQYFRASAPGYIGKQITTFAINSPIRGLLLQVASPHAQLFGALIAYGELAIGLGALAGVLLRPAAFFGALLSLIFFLSASWRIHPYFYGSDIVFLFGWITILLAGTVGCGWPTLDPRLAAWIMARVPPRRLPTVATVLRVALGIADPTTPLVQPAPQPAAQTALLNSRAARPLTSQRGAPTTRNPRARSQRGRPPQTTRREFIRGAAAGIGSTLALVFLVSRFRQNSASAQSAAPTATSAADTPAATTAADATATGGTAATTIAQVGQVPTNSSADFTIPSNGDPGIVVHLPNGKFVAFDATCTHAGCPVQYDPGSSILYCPCHGAEFDPAQGASVIQGPTDTPLTSVPIQVDVATGAIRISG